MLSRAIEQNRSVPAAQAIEALYATGYALHERGRHRDALLVFRAMITLVPRDERGWVALGDCHEKLGKNRVALELYSLGCAAAAPAPRCELARSRVLRALARHEEAEEALERALAVAAGSNDETLVSLVASEKRRAS